MQISRIREKLRSKVPEIIGILYAGVMIVLLIKNVFPLAITAVAGTVIMISLGLTLLLTHSAFLSRMLIWIGIIFFMAAVLSFGLHWGGIL